MKIKTTTIALVVAVAGATGFAVLHDDSAAASAPSGAPYRRAQPLESDESEGEQALPPDHPALEPGAAATAGDTDGVEPTDLPAALTWKAPPEWPAGPNPSSMRIATHKVPRAPKDAEDAELSISRAGGDVEANVQRWVEQFEGTGKETHSEKHVRGLAITVVEVEGTYQGGMGAASAPRQGWALLGAIVPTPEQPYFFKLTGPAATVHAARAKFDALLDGVAPAGAPSPK